MSERSSVSSGSFMLIASIVILSVITSTRCQDFGYDGAKGPSHWGEQYNSCTGKHQSPININSLEVKKVNLPPLVMNEFDTPPAQTNLTNNGHTVAVTMSADHTPSIAGGPLKGEYRYSQLHFHWGDNDTVGSEDMIDNHIFPMELHVVFFKQQYKNAKQAMKHSDGLTVLAFFYEISPEDNPNYEEFVHLLGNVTSSHKTAFFINPPSLRDLIARDLLHYYTYDGSLTTPPCSEVVTWIDFKEPILLSHAQIEAFRALEDDEGHPLTHNFRPIQPLGDRVVMFNTDEIVKDVDLGGEGEMPPDEELEQKLDGSEKHDESQKSPRGGRKGHPDSGTGTIVASWTVLLLLALGSVLVD
ncbi:carbonic anhydrase 7 [Wyeomyia smithii]|uniref:carbonic anhydrase 7 n=1 Tax=Wyeomyia smithii TaxID=174621 RepID=UPI002467DD63|nr:carbonic anhydrase 7 [Wyeomyia smithii]XP_055530003.1 carbonic anhydrase 7 [Wyeomyia smithii]XP_055530004.1 carbonic anhydrase 7 [Wyeomyia smithii]XP_055530005.1 carbonic anhydrase 7 [Wyeomyia smithii]XP_055530006.1 carbonic anhydrase 7 [Wyeomyia smithii]XP_055530008.1 carbonic anhydrase 7 [Wyeomyia smithii]XP_055530009.1 carbonic anhydrase 7 [Wyeomyia smithii]XP_055530010.1 carbonic anhydrase 7 [Wyeomyia smithii]